MLKKGSYKWIVFLSFLALIFLPKQMPLEWLKWTVIIVTAAICLIFEFASIKGSTQSETRQTWLLMFLTVAMATVNFMLL